MCMFDLMSKLLTLLVIAYICTTTSEQPNSYLYEASIVLKFLTLGQVLTGLYCTIIINTYLILTLLL